MPCVRCGGKTGVHNTRSSGESVWRRHTCRACGHRFTTYEFPVESVERWERIEGNHKKVGVLAKDLVAALDAYEFADAKNLAYQIKMLAGGL